jgi:hypothetical protein
MSDIVERLRSTEFASAPNGLNIPVIWVKGEVAREAADEIEKLREALSELVDIVEHALEIKSTEDMDSFTLQPARAALGEKE